MDRRGWPWKKKSSDKAAASNAAGAANQADQVNSLTCVVTNGNSFVLNILSS
jgi:hypothetical protein